MAKRKTMQNAFHVTIQQALLYHSIPTTSDIYSICLFKKKNLGDFFASTHICVNYFNVHCSTLICIYHLKMCIFVVPFYFNHVKYLISIGNMAILPCIYHYYYYSKIVINVYFSFDFLFLNSYNL